ncbi:DEAD/DEAH box helicase [Atopobacter sp. AH10]|uniref:DEAD/DEAH box helicase n=1 Tax=Atopobacter sp. AH10 TaxID=2315861 RepID=UPI000EF29033|nr:DEAD/DEAH box helicase [Atopobacter sp. AH10]RLK63252.1 DEAD/DEAH box helicase [Atopobacter sp. AH10]
MKFKELDLPEFMQEALRSLHFEELTPIQEAVIPEILAQHSLIGQSQTGSGKSHSFLVPLLSQIDPQLPHCQLVITSPSRELAEQLYQMANELASFRQEAISIELCVGGVDKQKQIDRLNKKAPNVVIATPGRLLDLMKENALLIQYADHFVVDEADMTMDMGFLDDLDAIASRLKANVHFYAFSATMPQALQQFLDKYMNRPKIIRSEGVNQVACPVSNYLVHTKGHNEMDLLYQLLTMGHPFLVIIFASTIKKVNEVAKALKERGLTVATLHGDLDNRERKRIMKRIRQLDFQYVVASDLASRGLDIPEISHVVNVDLPGELEFFIHRVGRTGRLGLQGTAYTFFHPDDEKDIQWLESKGIVFQHVEWKNNELVKVSLRDNRERTRRQALDDLSTETRGFIKKKKKNIKPGYKRKITLKVENEKRKNRRLRKKRGK